MLEYCYDRWLAAGTGEKIKLAFRVIEKTKMLNISWCIQELLTQWLDDDLLAVDYQVISFLINMKVPVKNITARGFLN